MKFNAKFRGFGPLRVEGPIEVGGVRLNPAERGILIEKPIEIKGTDISEASLSANQSAEQWGQAFEEALCVLNDAHIELSLYEVQFVPPSDDYSGPHTASLFLQVRATGKKVLTDRAVVEAMNLAEQLNNRSSNDLLRRALRWYLRGLRDGDQLDRFIDFWISLETLSNIYEGKVKPSVCPYCGKVLSKRPGRAVLREFLRSVGLEVKIDAVMELSELRGSLFHLAASVREASANQHTLRTLLRDCLQRKLAQLGLSRHLSLTDEFSRNVGTNNNHGTDNRHGALKRA